MLYWVWADFSGEVRFASFPPLAPKPLAQAEGSRILQASLSMCRGTDHHVYLISQHGHKCSFTFSSTPHPAVRSMGSATLEMSAFRIRCGFSTFYSVDHMTRMLLCYQHISRCFVRPKIEVQSSTRIHVKLRLVQFCYSC